MPKLHLTKVAFGCASLEALEQRVARGPAMGEMRVATRMRPKRADELIGGIAPLDRQAPDRRPAVEILRFEDRKDGRIDIVCSAELELVPPTPQARPPGLALSRGQGRARPAMATAAASPSFRRGSTASSPRSRWSSRLADAIAALDYRGDISTWRHA